jgi:high-affinity Fe2+/Pb2+ permease
LNAALLISELFDQLDVTLESSKIVKLALTWVATTQSDAIKQRSFIQTCLTQSESASPKATTLYVYNMSLFLVACLLDRWQRASSARCLQNKARGLTTPRSSKPLFPDSADAIGAEIEVSQRWALP